MSNSHEKEFEPARWANPTPAAPWMTVYEEPDGMMCAITIRKADQPSGKASAMVYDGTAWYNLYAQTRTVQVTPEKDTDGFARWVETNANSLVHILGKGTHWGVWWGPMYQLDHHHFSLMNTLRWMNSDVESVPGLSVLNPLYSGPYCPDTLEEISGEVDTDGSGLVEGFDAKALLVFNWGTEQYERYPILPAIPYEPCDCGSSYYV